MLHGRLCSGWFTDQTDNSHASGERNRAASEKDERYFPILRALTFFKIRRIAQTNSSPLEAVLNFCPCNSLMEIYCLTDSYFHIEYVVFCPRGHRVVVRKVLLAYARRDPSGRENEQIFRRSGPNPSPQVSLERDSSQVGNS